MMVLFTAARLTAASVVMVMSCLSLVAHSAVSATSSSGDGGSRAGSRFEVQHVVDIPTSKLARGDRTVAAGGGNSYFTLVEYSTSWSRNSTIDVFDVEKKKLRCSFTGATEVSNLMSTSDGKYGIATNQIIKTFDPEGDITVFETETCKFISKESGYYAQLINDTAILFRWNQKEWDGDQKYNRVRSIPDLHEAPGAFQPWMFKNNHSVLLSGKDTQNNYPENENLIQTSFWTDDHDAFVDIKNNETISLFKDGGPEGRSSNLGFDHKYYYSSGVYSDPNYLWMYSREKYPVLKYKVKLPDDLPLIAACYQSNRLAPVSFTAAVKTTRGGGGTTDGAEKQEEEEEEEFVTFQAGSCYSEALVITVNVKTHEVVKRTHMASQYMLFVPDDAKETAPNRPGRIMSQNETSYTVVSYPENRLLFASPSLDKSRTDISWHVWRTPLALGEDTGLGLTWDNLEGKPYEIDHLQVRSAFSPEVVFNNTLANKDHVTSVLAGAVFSEKQEFFVTARDRVAVFKWKRI